jgi:UDP-N-acetylmuramoyl-tripeptide--D-alanyl-D-alanine ligase
VDRLWAHGCKVVAITGSTGKTSTKDILVALLQPVFGDRLASSPRNYNTEVGLPLAALQAGADTQVLVLEMAMRGPGQIAELCEIAPPQLGVITNVGPVHLELLGTVEAIAEAKAELIAALPPDGFCVVPADAEALHPHLRREVRTLTFGHWPPAELNGFERVAGAAADIRVLEVEPAIVGEHEGLRAQVAVAAETVTLEFNFAQAHNLVNGLAAIGAAHALGVKTDRLREGARRVELSELRGEEIQLGGGVLVINDCYNANPISMRAALDHLAQTVARRSGARSVAVLGDMAELGAGARDFHREIGAYAARSGVGALVAIGELAEAYAEGFGDAGEVRRAATADDAAAFLVGSVGPGDVLLIKGSRSMGLERIAERLGAADGRGEG